MPVFGPMTRSLACLVLAIAPLCTGQEAARDRGSITVIGHGSGEAVADTATISATVHGSAEIAAEARTMYSDNRRRALEALEGLAMDNLTITGNGPSLSSAGNAEAMQQMMMGNDVTPTTEVTVSETLTLTLDGLGDVSPEDVLEQVMSIVDEAKDAGLMVGSASAGNLFEMQMGVSSDSPLVTFGIDDAEPLFESAYAAAIADARSKAQRLARLSELTLGPIDRVRELSASTQDEPNLMSAIYGIGDDSSSSPTASPTSDTMGPIRCAVSVEVRFELE